MSVVGTDVTLQTDFLPLQHLGTSPTERVTPYFVVEKVAGRNLTLRIQKAGDDASITLHAEPGSFVTVLVSALAGRQLEAVPVIDRTEYNQNRARLAFYNTTTCASAALVVEPSGAAVFEDVGPGATKSRTVNPVQATVRAICADRKSSALDIRHMEIGGLYSAWLIDSGEGLTAFLTQDMTARWKARE